MATQFSPVEQRARFSERLRPSIDVDINRDPYRQSTAAHMFMRSITERFTNSNHDISVFEVDLHDLWYMLIQSAKAIAVAEPAADQLASQVLLIRNWGSMSRIRAGDDGYELAITTTQERIWTDLPFLACDLQRAWSCSEMTAVERRNLAGFVARLAMFGIYTDKLIACSLGSFAEVLETSAEQEAEITADQVLILDAWLRYGGFAILSASARGYTSTGAYGTTAFTVARWDLWKQRLEELQHVSTSNIVEQLKLCINMMHHLERTIGANDHPRDDALKAYFHT